MHFGGLDPSANPQQASAYPEATTHQTGSTTYEQQVHPQHTGVSEIGQAPPVYQNPDEKTAAAGYTGAQPQSPAPQAYGYDGTQQGHPQQPHPAPEAIHMNSYNSQQTGQVQGAGGYYDGKPAQPQQQGIPQQQQQQGQGSRYQNAVPLGQLQSGAAPVDCPFCGKRELTRTEFVSGSTTHVSALLLCCFVCLGCIPYMASWFKDVEHKCGSCGALLAIWHRSGRTEVLAHH